MTDDTYLGFLAEPLRERNENEIEDAIIDALAKGNVKAWRGDGVMCVANMIRAVAAGLEARPKEPVGDVEATEILEWLGGWGYPAAKRTITLIERLQARVAELELQDDRSELDAAEAEVARLQGGLNILVNCQSSLPRAAMREACAELLRGRTIGMANQSTAVRLVAAEALVGGMRTALDDINKTAAQVAVDGGDSNEWLLKSIAEKAQAALAAELRGGR